GILRLAWDIALVFLGTACRPGARGIPARAQLRIYPGRARSRRIEHGDHLQPPAAERADGDDDDSAVHPAIVRDAVHLARLPRRWPAAWLAVARLTAFARQGERAGAVAWVHWFLQYCIHAVAADLHR